MARKVRTENVRECSCGRAYEVYPMFCGDQSRCPQCRADLAKRVERDRRPDTQPPPPDGVPESDGEKSHDFA